MKVRQPWFGTWHDSPSCGVLGCGPIRGVLAIRPIWLVIVLAGPSSRFPWKFYRFAVPKSCFLGGSFAFITLKFKVLKYKSCKYLESKPDGLNFRMRTTKLGYSSLNSNLLITSWPSKITRSFELRELAS